MKMKTLFVLVNDIVKHAICQYLNESLIKLFEVNNSVDFDNKTYSFCFPMFNPCETGSTFANFPRLRVGLIGISNAVSISKNSKIRRKFYYNKPGQKLLKFILYQLSQHGI